MKRFKKTLFFGVFSLIIGIALLISIGTREKIYSINDLIEINGRLKNYSFTKYGSSLNQIYSYHLFLEKYSNDFIILTDYSKYFKKSLFEESLKPGDSIMIEIYSKDFKNLTNQKQVRIYGLSDSNRTYLNYSETIKELNSTKYNFFAAAFIIAGIIALFMYFDK